MAQRGAFKTDSSFFRMLAIGAVGARAVQLALNARGHEVVELERGSLSTRVWRDVKRKRVRIPDLCCVRCGIRVESRAKTSPELTMSHSPRDAERAWDYGMLDGDWIAFPVLGAQEHTWSSGLLKEQRSLWRERALTSWTCIGFVNFFRVGEFRTIAPKERRRKVVTEGSEVQVSWSARFAKSAGRVTAVDGNRIEYEVTGSASSRHFRLGPSERSFLKVGDSFEENQVIGGQVQPLAEAELGCAEGCGEPEIGRMLSSRERTMRFTGAKLARLRRFGGLETKIRELAADADEDIYVQMEARAFLCEVVGDPADAQFGAMLLRHVDPQIRLEAAVALAETNTHSAFSLLRAVLRDTSQPLFLRTACAWALGSHATEEAAGCLINAFADMAPEIREEALTALSHLGATAAGPLIEGLRRSNEIAAGCAEVLRRIGGGDVGKIVALAENANTPWPTWTLAHLPVEAIAPKIAALQSKRPEVHFALTVLWTFLGSWIADHWTPRAVP